MYRIHSAILGSFAGLALSFTAAAVAIAASPMAYGDDKGLSQEQATRAAHLDFTHGQRYESIIDSLGYPDARDEHFDWYRLPDSGSIQPGWFVVEYRGRTAIAAHWRGGYQ